jgi:Rrf2 family protein
MLITRETDYAIRTVLFLAKGGDRIASVTEISQSMHIPKSFLAKILQRLVLKGLVKSTRGAKGGFQIVGKPSDISLLTIMEAVQGPACINLCAVDGKKCRLSSTCCVHPIWIDMRRDIEKRLQNETIAHLLAE